MKIDINSSKAKLSIEVPDEEIKKTGEKIAGFLQKKLGLKKGKELAKPDSTTKQ